MTGLPLSPTSFQALWTFVLTPNLQASSPAPSSPPHSPSPSGSNPLQNEIPVYPSHPYSPDFCTSLSKIPQSFSNMAVSGVLSMQMVRVIGRIPRTIADGGPDSPSSPVSASSSELYSVLTDLLRLATLQTTRMEHLLCHGLVAYCLPLQYPKPLPEINTSSLSACIDAYMRHNPNGDQMDRKCLIWIAVMIASALDTSADRSLANSTVLDQALSRYPEARNASTLVQTLQSFLWHDDMAHQWKATWEMAMERRRKASPSSAGPSPASSTPSLRAIPLESILNQETKT